MHETLFASTEGRMLGVGLALIGLVWLAFGIGWRLGQWRGDHRISDRLRPWVNLAVVRVSTYIAIDVWATISSSCIRHSRMAKKRKLSVISNP